MTTDKSLTPFLKWAGGKRQLLHQIKERMPKSYNNYYEPFVGGGAVLFELQPKCAVINDINEALINTYRVIASTPDLFIEAINELDITLFQTDDAYYEIRNRYNYKLEKFEYDIELAAMFVFLNKHCFNGLYRVSKQGKFNVPYNKSKNASINKDHIIMVSRFLQNVTMLSGDFEYACANASEGDFVFFDSPYIPLTNSTFTTYTKEDFDNANHIRLANLYNQLSEKGCYCMLTNHNTDYVHALYHNKKYTIDVLDVKRMINSDSTNRVGEEVIIYNYQLK